MSTSLAQAEPVTLAEPDLDEITAGLFDVSVGDVNVSFGVAFANNLQASLVNQISFAPFGAATTVGSSSQASDVAGNVVLNQLD